MQFIRLNSNIVGRIFTINNRLNNIKNVTNRLRTFNIHGSITFQSRSLCSNKLPEINVLDKNSTDINDVNENISELVKNIQNDQLSTNLDILKTITDIKDFSNISIEESNALLQCCGSFLPHYSYIVRDKTCQNLYENLLKHNKIDLNTFKSYIQVCTENYVLINVDKLLENLKLDPDLDMFKLLLENVCHKGDINQAYKILEKMKEKSFAADPDVFNNLLLASTITGGLEAGQNFLRTIRLAQISESTSTYVALVKGVIINGNLNESAKVCSDLKNVSESELLDILKCVGLSGNHLWLPHIKHLYKNMYVSREFLNNLKALCVHLVHMQKHETSLRIFIELVDVMLDENYGLFIFDEMLKCDVDVNEIIQLAKELYDTNLNPRIFENITDLALKQNKGDIALILFSNLETVKPHFFWPILCNAGKQNDENKVFEILKKMQDFNVKLDYEGLECYVLRYIELDDPKNIINKLQNVGYSLKEIMSAVLVQFLRRNMIKEAVDLLKTYDQVGLNEDNNLIHFLSLTFVQSKDHIAAVFVLKRYCENFKNNSIELVGEFIKKLFKFSDSDYKDILLVLAEIEKQDLKISNSTSEALHKTCLKIVNTNTRNDILNKINGLVVQNVLAEENNYIPLPKHMNLEELECHLIELEEKGLKTRGVIRHLIRLHTNQGNVNRVNELYKKLKSEGFEESSGMKSSLMHNKTMSGDIETALDIYNDLKLSHFKIDAYKIIDLAKVLIEKSRFEEAKEILNENTKTLTNGNKSFQRNCIEMLKSCQNEDEIKWCYNFFIQHNTIKPSVYTMAPLVDFYIKSKNIKKAAEIYAEMSKKYRCTPCQMLMFKEVLKTEDTNLLSQILNATQNIHAKTVTQFILCSALAENGQEKPLRNVLLQSTVSIRDFTRQQCKKWMQENNLDALKTLAIACRGIRTDVVDEMDVNSCLIQLYVNNKNYEEARRYFETLNDEWLINRLEKILVRNKNL